MGPIQVVVEDGNNLVLEVTPTPDTTVILDRGIAGPVGPMGDGDVDGPASSTDNAVARFDGTTGKLIQNSLVTVSDTGAVAGVTTLAASGAVTLSGLTASTALALDASKNVVSVTNTGTGNNVLATSPSIATPTLTGDVQMTTGNLVVGTSGKGIDFSATPNTGTSELLSDYEEGAWTPVFSAATAPTGVTYNGQSGKYIKIGQKVTLWFEVSINSVGTGGSGDLRVEGMPYASANASPRGGMYFHYANGAANSKKFAGYIQSNSTFALGDSGGTGMTWADIGPGTLYMATMEYYTT
jgi:hypothetical protein